MKNPFFKLNKYANNITSQFGEDGIISHLIETSTRPIYRTCIEFGAHDGLKHSNTYNLWHNNGWKAILIEADIKRFQKLEENFSKFDNCLCLNEFVDSKGKNNLYSIITRSKFLDTNNVGLLSIDIDSFDGEIFKNLNFKPQIIVIEYNNSIPLHIEYIDPKGKLILRTSAKYIQNKGFEMGYITVALTSTNVILLRYDCYSKENHPNLPVEYLADYSSKNLNDNLYSIIVSQGITSRVFFTNKPNIFDRYYFRLTRFIKSFINKNNKYLFLDSQSKSI